MRNVAILKIIQTNYFKETHKLKIEFFVMEKNTVIPRLAFKGYHITNMPILMFLSEFILKV